jgi:hypothetical protein
LSNLPDGRLRGLPFHFGNAGLVVGEASEDEQEIGQPVEIRDKFIADVFVAGKTNDDALGAPTDGPGEMQPGGNG